ncbi:hypothetical protein [Bradyrhizobium septentrionale]|uniref:Uncharacterized protein n=1 Tax=Bradyrhizobium septentrionale TaxID=1404411 RepID=A0A973VUJ9_9BRAD|nr:hypothetical protein [Bradyrhizobium septentrionale]UGY19041.1 hypothetical protein HAP48_0017270 [Bradyrhizobium septentrionale]
MPNARLHLILCSDDIALETRGQRRDRSFQPFVIDGGKQTASVPVDNPWADNWIDLLDAFDFGVVVCHASYLALLGASLAALQPQLDM